MKTGIKAIMPIALLFVSPYIQAADFNYNYVDISAGQYTPTPAGNAGTGYSVAGSYGMTKNLNVQGVYDSVTLSGAAVSDLLVGVAYHMPMGDSADFVADINYRATTAASVSWTGYTGNLGFQFKVSDKVEMKASAGQTSASGPTSKTGTVYDIGAVYRVKDNLGINVNYHSDRDATGWTIFRAGVRFYL